MAKCTKHEKPKLLLRKLRDGIVRGEEEEAAEKEKHKLKKWNKEKLEKEFIRHI